MAKGPKADKVAEEEAMILGSFLEFAKRSEDEFARFLLHCGIDNDDIEFAIDDLTGPMTSTPWRTTGFAGRRSLPASKNSSGRSANRSWLVGFQNKASGPIRWAVPEGRCLKP